MAESKEYRIWTNCKTRCYNPATDAYLRYAWSRDSCVRVWRVSNDFVRF